MSDAYANAGTPAEGTGFNSRDSQILIVDGPSDTTTVPLPEHVIAFLRAERERIMRYLDSINESPSPGDPT